MKKYKKEALVFLVALVIAVVGMTQLATQPAAACIQDCASYCPDHNYIGNCNCQPNIYNNPCYIITCGLCGVPGK